MKPMMIAATLATFGALHGAQAQIPASQPLPQIITDAVAKQLAAKPDVKQDIKPELKPDGKPEAKAEAKQDLKASTAESRSTALLATSSEPVFDEGSARRMKDAIKLYKAIAARGGWGALPADAKFVIGASNPHDEALRRRLIASSDLAASEATGPYNAELTAGVKRFQARHGLPTTGLAASRTLATLNVPVEKRIAQLEASLQRIESIGFKFGPRYVVVNLPAAFAEAIENDKVVRRYRVIVGKSEKPSPTVTSEIGNINLNPTWTVPASITKNEIAAHMRKDPGYLARMHMQALDAKDNPVDPASVDWSEGKVPNVIVRQEPGEWNALGRLKINMPNSYAVYMHDTNQRNLFTDDYRFDSHGCVRVDNVRDLAAWLMQETPNWSRAEIDAAIATNQRQEVKLATKVPVAWIYLTGWMGRDQTVQFRNDVYDQDTQLLEASSEVQDFFKQASDRNGDTITR
ncbi:MAG: murein L,D-transpeptidase, partial [Tardiphaga sp.]|nr:murein L,D-transpeptidase [Tardiphaga sp.]